MNLTKYNRPFPAAFRFFDDNQVRGNHARPAVNIIENDNGYELEVLAPGRVKENFNVDLFDGILEITYTTEKTGEEVAPTYRRHEFSLGDFTRRFRVNDDVINDEDIKATYTDGILRLSLPKRPEAVKTVRQIEVA